MKTIGLIGGMSWQSSLEYYRILNDLVSRKLNRLHSAKCILYSFDFEDIAEKQRKLEWDKLGEMLSNAAKNLEDSGADVILICTNTMHKVADAVAESVNIPLLNIIDVTAERIKKAGLKKVGLLGTKFTMEDNFYRDRLEANGLDVLIPEADDRDFVHKVIFNELCRGIFKGESKKRFLKIIEQFIAEGAEGIILGCTEIPLLVSEDDVDVPLFDTTRIHAESAVEFALS
jgi:aspartate racemase